MVTRDKLGTSIKNLRPSNQDSTTNLGTLLVLERQTNSKFGAQTLDGGNYSALKEDSSPTCGIIESSMSLMEKMQNINQLLSTREMVRGTRNGRFSILMKQLRDKKKVLSLTSVSMLTDHSTSDQDSQCKESWSVLEPTISPSRDGERTPLPNSGTSIQYQRPLDLNNGRTVQWKFKAMVEVLTSE